jgi:hypothetical protein
MSVVLPFFEFGSGTLSTANKVVCAKTEVPWKPVEARKQADRLACEAWNQRKHAPGWPASASRYGGWIVGATRRPRDRQVQPKRPSVGSDFATEKRMRKPKRTADQLTALIRDRAAPFGSLPAKMTMLLCRMNDTWEVRVSPGKSPQEEEFRITVMWIATQIQHEFDLRQ